MPCLGDMVPRLMREMVENLGTTPGKNKSGYVVRLILVYCETLLNDIALQQNLLARHCGVDIKYIYIY